MGGCFTTTKKDINMKNITDGKPQQSQMADGGQTRNKAASEIPRNTDSLNSSQGSVGVSNRSRGDGSQRGHDVGTPSMDNAYRQWEKPTKSPQQEPVGVHVEDAPGNSRSRGDGSDGKDLNEKIQRFKEKHKVGTDGKTSKYTHRRSLSATTSSSSEDSPGGRSLFRKRSSTFSIGDSKDSSRRRQTPNSTNMNNSGGGRGGGGARPFGILSVLKEMNETGSFSRPNSNSMGQLEGLPVADKTTSELTYTTTTMSGILPAQKTRSNSASPALSTSTGTTTTSSSSSSSSSESNSGGSSTTTTPSTTTVTLSKNSTSKSSTPTPVVTPVQNVATSSTSSSTTSANVTTIHQTSFPFTSPTSTTSTITTSSSFSVSNDGSAYTTSSPSLSSSTTALLNPSPHSKPNSSTYEDSPTKGATSEDRPLLIPSSSEYEPRKSLLSGRKTLAK